MSDKEFPILTYADVQKINWFVADTIRDKGNTEASQYKLLALPLISLKRFLDMREEFKKDEIYTSFEYEMEENSLTAVLPVKMVRHPAYAVHMDKLEWYDIEWSDIVKYADNADRNEIEYNLGDNRCTVKTTAVDKVEFLFQVIESFSNPKTSRYFKSTDFTAVCKKYLPDHALTEIINELDKYKLDLKHAEEDIFADSYMDLMGRFAEGEGKKGGEFHTPSDLVKACIELMPPELHDGKSIKIGDITSGACTFMVYAAKEIEKTIAGDDNGKKKKFINSNVEFVTQEKSEWSLGLGEMNVLFHGYENHKSFLGNTITQWKNGFIGDYEGKLDYIYANPPYGLKDYGMEYAKANSTREDRWSLGVPNKSEGEYAFILSILNLLSDTGKALIVLPLGTLFKNSTQEIRKRIIENDWLEGIITLPEKMFLTTNIPVCLWIINKNKKDIDKKKVFMIDASNSFIKTGKFNKWSKDDTIKCFIERINIDEFSKSVTIEEIVKYDYNISPNKSIEKKFDKENIDIKLLNVEIENLIESVRISINKISNIMDEI
jgi:type I restriction enzyme M protein